MDKPASRRRVRAALTSRRAAAGGEEITDLKRQMEDMQKRLDRLSDKDKEPSFGSGEAREPGSSLRFTSNSGRLALAIAL